MIVLLAIVKNERPAYLREWHEHHTRLGIEHMFLLEHAPNDIPIPPLPNTTIWPVPQARVQVQYYFNDMLKIRADWCVVIDCDEFIVCDDLPGLLASQPPEVSAFAMYWMIFGSNGYETPVHPVHGNYHWHLPATHRESRIVKSIVRPQAVIKPGPNPHVFFCPTVDELGRQVTFLFNLPPSYNRVRLNHYYTRSAADWKLRVARGRCDVRTGYHPDRFKNINAACTEFMADPRSL